MQRVEVWVNAVRYTREGSPHRAKCVELRTPRRICPPLLHASRFFVRLASPHLTL